MTTQAKCGVCRTGKSASIRFIKVLTMGRASKRTRAISIDTDPLEPVEVNAKRSRGAQPESQPLPQERVDDVNAPVRDRREVMADVARRQVAVCIWSQAVYNLNC